MSQQAFHPQFANPEALADWLESLHECDASGTVGNRKWEPAQTAARAVRGTLKAAQGGVTEAMVERALIKYAMLKDQAVWPDAYSYDECEMERRDMRAALEAALEAALSAQQGQGEAKPVAVFNGYVDGEYPVVGWLGKPMPVGTLFYSAPPAQPAERVPEGVLGYFSRDDAEKLLKRKVEERINFSHVEAWNRQSEFYPVALTDSPARSEGGKGKEGVR